ncbi:MAG TPA: cation diffusion facilitator family transporter [Chakrabartia sp.]|jgi:cobalt-zinc-cadmium efflux system protein|nr:cation diffusion facilitator family transporter [Chakrabartia sp.]
MAEHHDHHAAHGHHHGPADFGRAFALGILLNTAFVVVEALYGLASGSTALLADAGHNLSDVLGLAIAWAGARLAAVQPSTRFTYGLRGSTVLAALANGLLLMVAVGAIALEAVQRLGEPAPVAGKTVMVVAAIGILVNLGTALLFARGRKGDINIRGAFLHMAGDAAVSAGVVVSGAVILMTGMSWIDPLVSLAIAALIFWQTWALLREALAMALNAVPAGVDYEAVRAALGSQAGVADVHHLHIWPVSTTETVLTAHLHMPGGHPGDGALRAMEAMLHDRFGVEHATLQIETGAKLSCATCG